MMRKLGLYFLLAMMSGLSFASMGYAQDAKPENKTETAKAEAKADTQKAEPARYDSISAMIKDTMPEAAQNQKAKKSGVVSADARQYVDAVQNYYDNAKTYSASFVQDYETVDGVKKQSTGVVWFKKPGLMRWDYEKPEARFLISDGKYFWSWEPVYRQYCKQNLGTSQLPTALTFLAGTGRIEDDFSVKLNKVNGNQVSLELTPVVPSLAYEHIQFEILMPTAKVYRATIFDAMGNSNKITFKSPEMNAPLDDSSFRFEPPADAKHICE